MMTYFGKKYKYIANYDNISGFAMAVSIFASSILYKATYFYNENKMSIMTLPA